MHSPFRLLESLELSSFGNLVFLKLYIILVCPLCVILIFFPQKTIIPQNMIECWHPNQRKRNLVAICACVQLLMFFKYYFANNFKMDKWCGVPQSWKPFAINDLEDQMTSMAPTPLAHFIMPNCDLRCFLPWLFKVFSIKTPQCIQSRVSWVDQVAKIIFCLHVFLLIFLLVFKFWKLGSLSVLLVPR